MSLSLITEEKPQIIYRKDKVSNAGNNYSTFSTKVSSKNKNDEWESAFIELQFKKADQDKITNKCKIEIKKSFPVLNTYNERTTIRWQIMDFNVVEEGEAKSDSEGKLDDADTGFLDIPGDSDLDELQFE